jgi:hypothetical protein
VDLCSLLSFGNCQEWHVRQRTKRALCPSLAFVKIQHCKDLWGGPMWLDMVVRNHHIYVWRELTCGSNTTSTVWAEGLIPRKTKIRYVFWETWFIEWTNTCLDVWHCQIGCFQNDCQPHKCRASLRRDSWIHVWPGQSKLHRSPSLFECTCQFNGNEADYIYCSLYTNNSWSLGPANQYFGRHSTILLVGTLNYSLIVTYWSIHCCEMLQITTHLTRPWTTRTTQ